MKKLKLRRETLRLVDRDMARVVGGMQTYACTTAISCGDELGCLLRNSIACNVQGPNTTAIHCP